MNGIERKRLKFYIAAMNYCGIVVFKHRGKDEEWAEEKLLDAALALRQAKSKDGKLP